MRDSVKVLPLALMLVTPVSCLFGAADAVMLDGFYGADGHRDATRCACRIEDGRFRFRFDVKDATPCTPADAKAPERGLEDFDRVELFFSPTPDMSRPYCCMEVGINGAVLDYRATYYRQMNYWWGFKTLRTGAVSTADGYVVTGSVAAVELAAEGVNTNRFWLGAFRADFAPGCRLVDWYAAVPQGPGEPDFHRPQLLMPTAFCNSKNN